MCTGTTSHLHQSSQLCCQKPAATADLISSYRRYDTLNGYLFRFFAYFLPSSSFTFIATIPNTVQVHRSMANKESRLDGFKQEKSAWELGERRRKKQAEGGTQSRENCWNSTGSLLAEGRVAGQTGGGSLFPNKPLPLLPACTKAELQKQDRGSRQGMAMLGTDQLNHRVRSSNSRWGRGYVGPWTGKERNTGGFCACKGSLWRQKGVGWCTKQRQNPLPSTWCLCHLHGMNRQRKGRASTELGNCFCKPAPDTTR